MKCWKCSKEIEDGASNCVYCGTSQFRSVPETVIGRALRALYDRYGAQVIFSNNAYLFNGLGDLVDDVKKLRNQLKMALDAGIGRIYLEQINHGVPDSDFDCRIKILLTDDAGLSDKTANEIMGYFDEMIGWRINTQPQTHTHTHTATQQAKKKVPGSDEINRTERYTAPAQEIERPNLQSDRQTTDKTESTGAQEEKKTGIGCVIGCLGALLFFGVCIINIIMNYLIK